MELRPKEDNPQEQSHYTDTISLATHVLNKTKLMPDWLQRQADCRAAVRILCTPSRQAGPEDPLPFSP